MTARWLLPALLLVALPVGRADAPDRPRAPAGAGIGPAHTPSSAPRSAPAGALRCGPGAAQRALAHVELFARGRVVIVPAGIGLGPPRRREGAYVRSAGGCRYPLWTDEPTGLVRLSRGDLRLGDLFAVWGRPLSRERLAGWRGPVRAHVDGRPWRGDPRAIPLRRHAQIVVQVGAPVLAPNADYRFPAT
jgi:hypothetical protein